MAYKTSTYATKLTCDPLSQSVKQLNEYYISVSGTEGL